MSLSLDVRPDWSELSSCLLGDVWVPRAAAGGGVPVHRAAPQPAEEHDVIHPVLLCHGSHLLHVLHVHGEPGLYTHTRSLLIFKRRAVFPAFAMSSASVLCFLHRCSSIKYVLLPWSL